MGDLGPVIGVGLVFLIGIAVTRWIFRTDTVADNSIYQTNLLKKIAEKNGVSTEEINEACGIKPKVK